MPWCVTSLTESHAIPWCVTSLPESHAMPWCVTSLPESHAMPWCVTSFPENNVTCSYISSSWYMATNPALSCHKPVGLTLEAPRKNASEKWCLLKLSAANNCLTLLTNLNIEANRLDPDQTALIGAVWSGSTLFVIKLLKHFSRREKQTTFVLIGALRVKVSIS